MLFDVPGRDRPPRALPAPRAGRFVPLRAGILNVWEYDEQEFWFEGGRLILRGGNEAGKSKALELLLPFLFDADLRPARLDPFGDRAKTMFWNLVDFDPERRTAIGYTWLEFGRVGDDGRPAFVTLGAGMRATRGSSDVHPWYWVAHGRVGEEFALHDDGVPLSRAALREALGASGQVFDAAADYRDAVDRELFQLGPERYAALVNLLLQLRRPQLSAKLDPAALAAVLSSGLPPLDESRIAKLAEAFDRLDAEAAGLARIDQALRALGAFRGNYTDYARRQARRHASDVRGANSRLDGVTRRVRVAGETLAAASDQTARLETERAESECLADEHRGSLSGLDRSETMQAAQQLRDMERAATAERDTARQAHEAHTHAEAELAGAAQDLARAEAETVTARDQFERATREAEEAALAAVLAVEHDAHRAEMATAPDRARAALDGVSARRLETIRRLGALRDAHLDALQRLDEASRAASEAKRRLADVEVHARAAHAAVETTGTAFEESVGAWCVGAAAAGVVLAPDDGAEVARAVRGGVERGEPPRGVAEELVAGPRRAVEEARVDALARRTKEREMRRELTVRRASIAAEREDGPPPRAGCGTARASRPGGALWQLCDFAPHIPATERAAVESALESSGLLDAWVTPDGDVLAAETEEVVLRATAGTGGPRVVGDVSAPRTLADVLVPVTHEHVSVEIVFRALRAVAVVDAGAEALDATSWIARDGRWRLGALWGRWSKRAAVFVGAGARAAARARRLAELDAEIAATVSQLDAIETELAALVARDAALREALAAFPDGHALVRALADRAAADQSVVRAAGEVAGAERDVAAAESRRNESQRSLHRAADTAGLLAFLDDLVALAHRTHEYRRVLASLAGVSSHRLRSESAAAGARDRHGGLAARTAVAREQAEASQRRAAASAAELDTYREHVGAAVEEVTRRRTELVAAIEVLGGRLKELQRELQQVAVRRGAAERDLGAAEEERTRREADRTAAIVALSQLGRTEILDLAMDRAVVGASAPPTPWNVTFAMDLARAVESATSEMAFDEDALGRSETHVHEAFRSLRTDLGGDFDPTGSRVGGLFVVEIRHDGRMRRVGELEALLAAEGEKRRELLARDERELIERHLLGEVGHHLQERIVAARTLVEEMNRRLRDHPTNSGQTVRLRWESADDAEGRTHAALRVLERDVRVLSDADRDALVRFLRDRIAEARTSEGPAGSADRMARALDYRGWHEFVLFLRQDGRESRLTARTYATGSGGSKAVLVHLPLFAAAAAHYRSARPEAPHLVLLDEAFAGIDAAQRGSCMGLLVGFDLDFLLTNHEEWGCYAELPSVATYHLERHPPQRGVTAMRFVWNGTERVEDDPFLDARALELPL